MEIRIATVEEAERALDYLNRFHDGFMQRLVLVSHDAFDVEGAQSCSSRWDVAIDFAHSNYATAAGPLQPSTRIIEARFTDVQDVRLDLGADFVGGTILNAHVLAQTRRSPARPAPEPCLALRLLRSRYHEAERRWEPVETELFTFATAVWRER